MDDSIRCSDPEIGLGNVPILVMVEFGKITIITPDGPRKAQIRLMIPVYATVSSHGRVAVSIVVHKVVSYHTDKAAVEMNKIIFVIDAGCDLFHVFVDAVVGGFVEASGCHGCDREVRHRNE
jgi:hypothetical protein